MTTLDRFHALILFPLQVEKLSQLKPKQVDQLSQLSEEQI